MLKPGLFLSASIIIHLLCLCLLITANSVHLTGKTSSLDSMKENIHVVLKGKWAEKEIWKREINKK